MNKRIILILMFLVMLTTAFSQTDYLNFRADREEKISVSILFRNGGRLMFTEDQLVYQDEEWCRPIAYEVARYIFFGEEPLSIEEVHSFSQMEIIYNWTEQKAEVKGSVEISSFSLYNLDGKLLRSVNGKRFIPVNDVAPGLYVAVAVSDDCVISGKIVIY